MNHKFKIGQHVVFDFYGEPTVGIVKDIYETKILVTYQHAEDGDTKQMTLAMADVEILDN